ncbi:MAG: HAD-IC family P-type ATPase, partial [Planctomycetes bacterium]|nr:HAD-IC family P-type ATPase [Planctomycetota bacterium]
MCKACESPTLTQPVAVAAGAGAPARSGPSCSCNAPISIHEPSHAHDHGSSHNHGDEGEESFSWLWRIIVPGALLAVGILGQDWISSAFSPRLYQGMMAIAYLLCGLPVLRDAWSALRNGDFFNEFTLMSLATLVAIGLGEWAEAVGVMVFYSIGEAAQHRAAGKSRQSIRALLASKPETANLMGSDGAISVVAPDQVAVGSRVVVKPGEKIPLDGVVLSGRADLDMSPLTGESMPVAVEAGAKAYSGAICLDGDLVIETTALYSDSTVGRILSLVEDAVAAKSKTERFITVFARYYTPAVVAAAVLVAVLPPLLAGAAWNVWIYRALVLLVVSCPCALVLSIPLAFFAGIGAASRHGLLVKGGQVFDALAKARTVVFDKTGTLTKGSLSVIGIDAAAGTDKDEVLRYAAIGENRSTHPAAKAIIAALDESERA